MRKMISRSLMAMGVRTIIASLTFFSLSSGQFSILTFFNELHTTVAIREQVGKIAKNSYQGVDRDGCAYAAAIAISGVAAVAARTPDDLVVTSYLFLSGMCWRRQKRRHRKVGLIVYQCRILDGQESAYVENAAAQRCRTAIRGDSGYPCTRRRVADGHSVGDSRRGRRPATWKKQ
jgi:hypothetical protein